MERINQPISHSWKQKQLWQGQLNASLSRSMQAGKLGGKEQSSEQSLVPVSFSFCRPGPAARSLLSPRHDRSFPSEQQRSQPGEPRALQSGWTKEQARCGGGKANIAPQPPTPTSCRCRPGQDLQRSHAREPSAPCSPLQSPCCAFSFSLLLSPCPFPVSSSRLLCCPPGALAPRSLGAARPVASSAAPRRCPSAPRPRGRCLGAAAAAAGGAAAAAHGAARLWRRQPESQRCGRGGEGRSQALGPLKGAALAGGGRPCPRDPALCSERLSARQRRTRGHWSLLTPAATGPDIATDTCT